jgi:hypothetical protein
MSPYNYLPWLQSVVPIVSLEQSMRRIMQRLGKG